MEDKSSSDSRRCRGGLKAPLSAGLAALVLLYPYECVARCNGDCITTCRSLAGPRLGEGAAAALAMAAAAVAFAVVWVVRRHRLAGHEKCARDR